MATLPIASLYYSLPLPLPTPTPYPYPSPATPSPPPVPSGTRQHKTRNPRSSSRGCVRMSDIIKAVSHA